jgi:hypothetical protein
MPKSESTFCCTGVGEWTRTHRVIVELNPKERTRDAQVVQLEFCLPCMLHLFYLMRGCSSNEKVIDVNTDHAIGFVEYTVVRLGHGEAVGGQDAVDALVPNPRACFSPYSERCSQHTYPGSSKPSGNSI